ncbi:general substrate transporter [Lentithecium fluviatile CBS 122367]|uniref:General substrate transporter n=1 Tax=Lentithecium fluviatile CBS 122367 TaxID=1168545 RepID=A0A6G1IM73_9PLEO|nr:general substrate transporter [Lentithecium fluviatile CBS 122367]
MPKSANRYNYLIVFLVTFGSLTYGYNSAIIGAVIGLPSFFAYFNISLTGPNAAEGSRITGATNGLFAGGGLLGCFVITWLADFVGRKRSIQITAVLCVVAAAIQAGSVHIAMFLAGRFLMGIGVGMVNVITPLYQSEISPAASRGRMVGSHGFILCVGYALAGWTGFGCYYVASQTAQWRICLALQVVPPLCLFIGSPWLPESPRHLMANDRFDEGLRILRDLHRLPGEEDDLLAREEFYQIRKQLDLEREEGWRQGWVQGWILLFQRKSYRKRLLFGFLTLGLVQSTGCLVINNYQVLLYNGLGLYGSLPLMLYALWDTWAAFMNYMNSLWLDKIGRIPIMVIGQLGCAVSVAGFTGCVAVYGGTDNKIGNGFGVFFLYLFVTFFGGSMDASSYVYAGELFPTSIRAQGAGFSISALFCFSLIYTMCAPVAFNTVGWKYYIIFIVLPIVGATIMYLFYPETKGLSLEEISAKFGDDVAVDYSHMTEEERRRLGKAFEMGTEVEVIEDTARGDEKSKA